MTKENYVITLTHEQCADVVEKIVKEAKDEATLMNLWNNSASAFALGVLMVRATDWLAQLEELRGEILKIK